MSQQFDNTNRFVLFKNDRKSLDTHPDYTGTINIDGIEYFLDGWIKDGAKGKFISGKTKRKDKQAMGRLADDLRSNSPQVPVRASINDDVPF